MTLSELTATFARWLHLRDFGPLYAALGTVAANLMPGDPVWLMLVGPPSSGKSEILQSLTLLPRVFPTATLNEAALLSGTSKKEWDPGAKGGLLAEIDGFGIIVLKDFTSILSMPRDPQRQVLAALREIYDGRWTRRLGGGGGVMLDWRGKLGLLAGCTHAIESAHAVNSMMGERFVLCRMPLLSEEDERAQAYAAIHRKHQEEQMRAELAAAVTAFVSGLRLPPSPPELTPDEFDRLQALAVFVARARSAVERNSYHRDIEAVPSSEVSTRLLLNLKGLYSGLLVIGVPPAEAWELIVRVGFDSIPSLRRSILDGLINATDLLSPKTLADQVGCSASAVRRTLEDLRAHGLVGCEDGKGPHADRWGLTEWAWALYRRAIGSVPEG